MILEVVSELRSVEGDEHTKNSYYDNQEESHQSRATELELAVIPLADMVLLLQLKQRIGRLSRVERMEKQQQNNCLMTIQSQFPF